MRNTIQTKSRGTLYGLCIGDALAMPVIGALMGASYGVKSFPRRWVDGLVEPLPDILHT